MKLLLSGGWNTGNFDMTGIVSGTGTLQLKAAATSYIGTFPAALEFNLSATYVMGNNWTIAGPTTNTLAAVVNNDGTAKTLTCNGGLVNTAALSGSANIVIGGGTWSGAGGLANNLSFANSPIIGPVNYKTGTLSKGAGTPTVTAGTTFTITGSCTIDSAGIPWVNWLVNVAASITLQSAPVGTGYLWVLSASTTFLGNFNPTFADLRGNNTSAVLNLTLPVGVTLNITTSIELAGSGTSAFTFKSATGGQHCHLNYAGTPANCKISNIVFTDVDASGSAQRLDDWYGTLSGCTNIRVLDSALVAATEADLAQTDIDLAAEIALYDAEVIAHDAAVDLYDAEAIAHQAAVDLYDAEVILYDAEAIAHQAAVDLYDAEVILYDAEVVLYNQSQADLAEALAELAEMVPPIRPTIINCVRNGNAGTASVGSVAAGDTALVFATAVLPNNAHAIALIGSAVSVGGNTTVICDFTNFNGSFFSLPIPLPETAWAQTLGANGLYSEPSANAVGGLLKLSYTCAIASVVPASDKLSAVVTFTGVPAAGIVLFAWNTPSGPPGFAEFVGNGPHTVTGLDAEGGFSPTIMVISDDAARLESITGWCEPRGFGNSPRVEAVTAPYVEEVE